VEAFETIFGAPSTDKECFVKTVYKPTNEVVGFIGLVPRTIDIEGKEYKFGIINLLCVHPDHRKKGLAKRMGTKLFEIGKKLGYEGGFAYYQPEHYGKDTSTSVTRAEKIPVTRVATFSKFIVRIFDAKKTAKTIKLKWYEYLVFKLLQSVPKVKNPRIRKYKSEDLDDISEIMKDFVERNQVSIVPQYEDLKWFLNQPNVSCVVHEDENGKVDGLMWAWEFKVGGFGHSTPFGWLDLVHIHRLSKKDATDLCKYLCETSKERGWSGIQSPYIPYFDSGPLKKAKFFFFSMILHLDFLNLTDIPFPEKLESIYIEWR